MQFPNYGLRKMAYVTESELIYVNENESSLRLVMRIVVQNKVSSTTATITTGRQCTYIRNIRVRSVASAAVENPQVYLF
jgi:hypothetical protein